MAWIAAVAGIAGSYLSNKSSKRAAGQSQYQPWNAYLDGLGSARFTGGNLNITPNLEYMNLHRNLTGLRDASLARFAEGQDNSLGQQYLRDETGLANSLTGSNLQGLMGASGLPNSFFGSQGMFQNQALGAQQLGNQSLLQGLSGYGGQNFLNAGQNMLGQGYSPQDFSNLRGNMLSGFDPNQAASQYTNLLRQQALPQEQQAAQSALSGLFSSGRLGTTGGQQAYGQLMQAQNQADIGRQVAGQQHGLQQQLLAQQGLDSALNNEQSRQLSQFGANQQGMLNQYGMAQGLASTGAGLFGQAYNNAGMGLGIGQGADAFGFNRLMGLNDTGFNRAQQLYTASDTATQDRFARAMQLFGAENALNQQDLANFSGLLGSQQGQQQTLMDLARIGASVGQSQTAANANAAQMRNQGNQDMIAGLVGAIQQWSQNRPKNGG